MTAADLRAAVEEATTLYEVQRRPALDRDATRELFAEAVLPESAHGRVADRDRREEPGHYLEERFGGTGTPAESGSD